MHILGAFIQSDYTQAVKCIRGRPHPCVYKCKNAFLFNCALQSRKMKMVNLRQHSINRQLPVVLYSFTKGIQLYKAKHYNTFARLACEALNFSMRQQSSGCGLNQPAGHFRTQCRFLDLIQAQVMVEAYMYTYVISGKIKTWHSNTVNTHILTK